MNIAVIGAWKLTRRQRRRWFRRDVLVVQVVSVFVSGVVLLVGDGYGTETRLSVAQTLIIDLASAGRSL